MWMIMDWFQPFQKVISNPIFCPLYMAKKRRMGGGLMHASIDYGLSSYLSIINKMARAALLFQYHYKTFGVMVLDWNGIDWWWDAVKGMFTLNELLFPLELSASPPSAVREVSYLSIRGSKKMISLCYVPAIFRRVKAFQRFVHLNSPACSKQAHTCFTAGQVPPGSRVSRDSLRSGALRLGSVQLCSVSLTLGYGSKC